MLKKNLVWLLVTFGLVLVLTACGGGDGETPADEGAGEGTEENAGTGEAKGETGGEETSSLAAQGEAAYKQSCISCHGANLEGGLGPSLKGINLSKEEIVEIIKNGRGNMPGNLSPGNEEAIAEYLLSQQ